MGDIASPLVRFSTSAESFGSGGVHSSCEFGPDCLDEPVFEEEDDDNDVIGVEEDLLLRQRTRSSPEVTKQNSGRSSFFYSGKNPEQFFLLRTLLRPTPAGVKLLRHTFQGF